MVFKQIDFSKIGPQVMSHRGFTLLELIVYLVISGMLLATAVTAFLGQNSSYNRQDVVSEIQQNIRGAIEVISSDVRFAGTGLLETSDDPFASAQSQSVSINIGSDLDEAWILSDGSSISGDKKTIYYNWDPVTENLRRGFSIIDGGSPDKWETVAENIEELRFQYLMKNGVNWQWDNNVPPGRLDDIRAVKIVMLGGARESAFNPTDTGIYRPPLFNPLTGDDEWTPAPGTGYKRMMSIVVQCRNNRG